MMEILKKLGLPATVAAVVALLVTVIPLVFKFDNRYAKEDSVNAEIAVLTSHVNALNTEVGKLIGTQQVIVALMSSTPPDKSRSRIVKSPAELILSEPTAPPPPASISIDVPRTDEERQKRLQDVAGSLARSQQRIQSLQAQ